MPNKERELLISMYQSFVRQQALSTSPDVMRKIINNTWQNLTWLLEVEGRKLNMQSEEGKKDIESALIKELRWEHDLNWSQNW